MCSGGGGLREPGGSEGCPLGVGLGLGAGAEGLGHKLRERIRERSAGGRPRRAGVTGCQAEAPERTAGGGRARLGTGAGCPARQLSSPGPAVTQARGRAQPGAERGAGALQGAGWEGVSRPPPGRGRLNQGGLGPPGSGDKSSEVPKVEKTQAAARALK